MRTQGKFLLFDSADEFGPWLDAAAVTRVVRLVQNHHTWLPNYGQFHGTNHFALLQGMEDAHLERGFAEIAQNLTTFPDGSIAVCRSLDKIPAGIKGANTGGVCIENLGNFDAGGDAMTAAHRDAILRLNALLCRKFSLAPSTAAIVYHHWYDLNTGVRTNGTGVTKTCPGTAFFGGNRVEDAAANFVPLVEAALAALAPVAPPAAPLGAYSVNASGLNVRTAPDPSAPVLKVLTRGVHVNAYAASGQWMRIHPTGMQWVNGAYLAPLA